MAPPSSNSGIEVVSTPSTSAAGHTNDVFTIVSTPPTSVKANYEKNSYQMETDIEADDGVSVNDDALVMPVTTSEIDGGERMLHQM